MGKVWGGALAVTAFIACPCHLPITLPLAISIFGGGAAAGFIAENKGLIYTLATAYFIGGLAVGWLLLTRRRKAEDCCEAPAVESHRLRILPRPPMVRRPVKTSEVPVR